MFDAEKERKRLEKNLKELSEQQGFKKVVLGISGGKDSTIAAAICARALGKENVYGVLIPDFVQNDINDSYRVVEAIGINKIEINIGNMHHSLLDEMQNAGIEYNKESDINVAPRLRMTVLRYITQALGARLCGTGNASEWYVGYCTKDGDTSCDFALLLNYTSIEVVQIGKSMPELPTDLVDKMPSDGLSGMSDEEKLGVPYQAIHDVIRHGTSGNQIWDEKINQMHLASAHKRTQAPVL